MNIDHLFSVKRPWRHQRQGVGEAIRAFSAGASSVCLTSPTGSGKSQCMIAITRHELNCNGTVLLITNRILLTRQTARVFEEAGVRVSVISASMPHLEFEGCPVRIATMQTILARRRSDPDYWIDASLIIVDEVHNLSAGDSGALIREYESRGAKVLGVTATPLGVTVCDDLIVAGRTRDLQDQGILCYADWKAPLELDTRKYVKSKVDLSLTEDDARRTWGPIRGGEEIRTQIVGNIIDEYRRFHPKEAHTLAFAPGVRESLWAARYCNGHGIRALHVDGQDFWCDGGMHNRNSNGDLFERYMQEWRDGLIPVLWNRFVCIDEGTEILTSDGWRGVGEVTEDHLVANWDDGRIYFGKPIRIVSRDRKQGERMVALETPRRSIRVTEDHELVYRAYKAGAWCKLPARSLVNARGELPVCGVCEPLPLTVEQPPQHPNRSRRISANAYRLRQENGYGYDDSFAEADRRISERESLRYKQPTELTDDECEFIGLWLGDGDVNELQRGGREYRLRQGEDCPQIVERIDELISILGLDSIRRRKCSNNGAWHIEWSFARGTGFGPQKRSGVFHLEPYMRKQGTDLFHALNDSQFTAVLRGLWMANGTSHRNTTCLPPARLSICSAKANLLDILQAVAVCRGWRASVRTYNQTKGDGVIHHLSLSKRLAHEMTKYRLDFEEGWKHERVWCVRTSSGNIVTRRNGSVTVMGNCREGIDEPQIRCLMLATPVGSYRAFLQMVGRALRISKETPRFVTVIDFGGNYWRHPRINSNVDWEATWGLADPDIVSKERITRIREGKEKTGIVCPKCATVHERRRPRCSKCGHEFDLSKPSRSILMANGELTSVDAEPVKQWKIKSIPGDEKIWAGLYWAAVRKKQDVTFNQLYSRFGFKKAVEYGTKERPAWWKAYYPPRNLPLMPRESCDFHRLVCDVPREDLY